MLSNSSNSLAILAYNYQSLEGARCWATRSRQQQAGPTEAEAERSISRHKSSHRSQMLPLLSNKYSNTQTAQIQKIKQRNRNAYLQSGLKSYHCCSQQTNTYISHIYTHITEYGGTGLSFLQICKKITPQVWGWGSWVIVVEDKGLEKSSASPPSHRLEPPLPSIHSPHSPTQISQLWARALTFFSPSSPS